MPLSLYLSLSLPLSLSFPVFVFASVFVFAFVFAWNSPRLVTLVVSVSQVVDVHLEVKTEGNIVPSESEQVPVQAELEGSGTILVSDDTKGKNQHNIAILMIYP